MKIGQKPELPGALAQTGLMKTGKPSTGAAEVAVKESRVGSSASVPVFVSQSVRSLDTGSRPTVDFDSAKVSAMRAAIAGGTFSVNADAIADKLLSSAGDFLSPLSV